MFIRHNRSILKSVQIGILLPSSLTLPPPPPLRLSLLVVDCYLPVCVYIDNSNKIYNKNDRISSVCMVYELTSHIYNNSNKYSVVHCFTSTVDFGFIRYRSSKLMRFIYTFDGGFFSLSCLFAILGVVCLCVWHLTPTKNPKTEIKHNTHTKNNTRE